MNHELNWQVAEKVMGERYLDYDLPDYSGSLDAAWEMEEEIERRGRRTIYTVRLEDALWKDAKWPLDRTQNLWRLIHATSTQRCEAALEAAKEKK